LNISRLPRRALRPNLFSGYPAISKSAYLASQLLFESGRGEANTDEKHEEKGHQRGGVLRRHFIFSA
jgi:hypothetical protein